MRSFLPAAGRRFSQEEFYFLEKKLISQKISVNATLINILVASGK